MRIWWYLLAVIFGFLAAVFTWLWPEKPLWTKVLPTSLHMLRFQPVPDKLIAIADTNEIGPIKPQRIIVLNALNGDFLQESELFLESLPTSAIEVAPDLRSVLVSEMIEQVDAGLRVKTRAWSIYDMTTGHRRFGPIRNGYLNARPWSSDARWLWATQSKQGQDDRSVIYSLETGELVKVIDAPDGFIPVAPSFSSNGSSLIVFWQSKGTRGQPRKHLITIHEIPSGRELVRLKEPAGSHWVMAREWDGESLTLVTSRAEGKKLITECFVVYLLQLNPLESARLDPILSKLEDARQREEGEYDLGATWIVEKGPVKPEKVLGNWFIRARDWLRNKLQVDITRDRYFASCYTRPEGTLRFELNGLTAPVTHVSNDGHLLLTSKRESNRGPWTLEAWDLYPPPRWPWSLLAGAGTATPILVLGYWRSRRKLKLPAIS